MIGTVGEPCLVRDEPDFAIKNVGLFKNKGELEGKWLYYFLTSPQSRQDIIERSAGTTQAYISLGALRSLPISVPTDRSVIQRIVAVLGALDDKIELNRRMNRTLEAMARALFRSWFVDFDPVHAKAEGRAPAHMDPATAALFPARFGEDGLPEGWVWDRLRRCRGHLRWAARPARSSGKRRASVARIRTCRTTEGGCFTDEVHPKEHVIQPGDIVVGMDGEFRARLWHGVPDAYEPAGMLVRAEGAPISGPSFCFCSPRFSNRSRMIVGTTVIHLGKKEIERFTASPHPGLGGGLWRYARAARVAR